MKRITMVFCVLIALTLFCPIFAFAEGQVDIKGMSTEELVSLRNAINVELTSRDFQEKEVTVPPGQYTIGEDIPAGIYTISKTGTMPSMIVTYTVKGDIDLSYNVSPSSSVGKITLEEGQTIEITLDSVVFAPYKGLGF